jgi:hypothetical protein
MKYKNRQENEQNNEHDKIIQYFPHYTKKLPLNSISTKIIISAMLKKMIKNRRKKNNAVKNWLFCSNLLCRNLLFLNTFPVCGDLYLKTLKLCIKMNMPRGNLLTRTYLGTVD